MRKLVEVYKLTCFGDIGQSQYEIDLVKFQRNLNDRKAYYWKSNLTLIFFNFSPLDFKNKMAGRHYSLLEQLLKYPTILNLMKTANSKIDQIKFISKSMSPVLASTK